MNGSARGRAMVLALWGAACAASRGANFTAPQKITDDAADYQIGRNANGALAWDESAGAIHATYWSTTPGGAGATTPAYPSRVYYRRWTVDGGWTAQEEIDDSETGGQHIGGRHPSLALGADGSLWVVWHDHRHCTAGGSWIDNIEIYADRKPPGGAFSATDLRLTTSVAAHNGDNGYVPKIAAAASGRVSVAWYDFNADAGVSDLYLKTSDAMGTFNLAETMGSMRQTVASSRGNAPPYAFPDVAVDPSGARHFVWIGGLTGSAYDLYYGVAPSGGSLGGTTLLASGASGSDDPPRIFSAANGDVWIAYGDDSTAPAEDLTLRRRRSGQPAFDAAIPAVVASGRQQMPDGAVDANGKVRLVWVDERAGRKVYYGVYDPALGAMSEQGAITPTGNWARPALAIDPRGEVYVMFEEDGGPAAGAIWFATTARPNAVDPAAWEGYR